jgi:hypothetical protein
MRAQFVKKITKKNKQINENRKEKEDRGGVSS